MADIAAEAAGLTVERLIDARGCLAAIIGARGGTVKRIQAETGARVDKLQETLQVRVSGVPSKVAAAVAAIEDVMEWASRAAAAQQRR